jgi:7-cyano-7-deazaguanine synthase
MLALHPDNPHRRTRVSMAVLVSGGLDSCVLLGELSQCAKVHPLYVRNGLYWERAEIQWLRRFLTAVRGPAVAPLTVLELPMRDLYGRHWSVTGRRVPGARTHDRAVYLPGRNLILLTKAALQCHARGIDTIALAPLARNPFSDNTPKFFRLMERTLAAGIHWRGRILAPYLRVSKTEVIRRGAALRLPLELTLSCLRPSRSRHCGRCNKCAERQQAFRRAGINDPTSYANWSARL